MTHGSFLQRSIPSKHNYDATSRLQTLGHDLWSTGADNTLTFGCNAASQIATRSSSNNAYASNTAYNVSRAYGVNGLNQYTPPDPRASPTTMTGSTG